MFDPLRLSATPNKALLPGHAPKTRSCQAFLMTRTPRATLVVAAVALLALLRHSAAEHVCFKPGWGRVGDGSLLSS